MRTAVVLFLSAVSLQVVTVDRDTISKRMAAVKPNDVERGNTLERMFADAGCPPDSLLRQPVKHARAPNVICTVPGTGPREIIVGAHFDHISRGLGVIDDWSGAALLPSLMESIRSAPRRHTFVFIGFTDEERGLVGSTWYVSHLKRAEFDQIRAMIDFDSIGTGPVEVDRASADSALIGDLLRVAATMEIRIAYVNIGRVGTSDFYPFRSKGVPVLLMHSITQETFSILHSAKDNFTALKMDDYYRTYRFAATYLSYLDTALDANP